MQSDHARAATFAANRARGAVAFDVHLQDGVTRRGALHESGSLRVRFPSPEGEGLSAVFVNTAGGIAGGDRFDTEITVGQGAHAIVDTTYRQAARLLSTNTLVDAHGRIRFEWVRDPAGHWRIARAETTPE